MKLLPNNICKTLTGIGGNVGVDLTPIQDITAVRGLVKHDLRRKLLISMRLITSSRTLTEVALTNSRKSEGLGNHALYLFGGTDKERCKMKSCHTCIHSLSLLLPILKLKW